MSENITHLNLDVQTLGLDDKCVILTLACIPFQLETENTAQELIDKGFFVKFDIEHQVKDYNRKINKDTLLWWKNFDKEVQNDFLNKKDTNLSLTKGLAELFKYIKNSDYSFKHSFVWSHKSDFTIPKIVSVHNDIGLKCSFNGNMVRDSSTMLDVLTGSIDGFGNKKDLTFKGYNDRNSLHRCAIDIIRMQKTFLEVFEVDKPF